MTNRCSQTHAIDDEHLPVFEDNTITPKRIDLCLSFSDQHADVQQHYAEFDALSVERVQISQMEDDYSSTQALFMGVEVKRQGEKETDAQSQLLTWLAAGVIHLRKLRSPDSQLPNLPLLGWTVVGHEWKLYAAYGEGNRAGDTIRILGPLNKTFGHTRDLEGIFQLLKLMQRLKTWAEATYWPWFTEHVLKSVLDEMRH